MALRFSVYCHLLSCLEEIARRDPPLLSDERRTRETKEIQTWFRAHRKAIDGLDARETVALLSSLLPERRTDRVYGLQSTRLTRIICRTLSLSSNKSRDLQSYRQPGQGDLGDCLERILEGGGPPAVPAVTLQEVDDALHKLASACRFSGPTIKQQGQPHIDAQGALTNVLRRLHPAEAKWLVRLVLKDLSPVQIDECLVLRSLHFLLPDILRFQQDFSCAAETLRGPFRKYPSSPDPQSAALLRRLVSGSYRPRIGVKISRSTFTKARSIDHCIQMTKKQRWMIERKYDGEYCEIHVDLTRDDDWLKIFSKSGKDSTQDRRGLRDILRKSLSIGSETCKIKQHCILLGEMVVYSDAEKTIMPFHKIRKYVSRSGTYLGTAKDSPPQNHERLMIVFFDLLLLDDNNVMQRPLEERKAMLQGTCKTKAGRAIISESRVLDFTVSDSKRKLMNHLAASVAARHEGLVLKPCGRPYLSIPGNGETDTSTVIKLKKDYINGLGDEADLAVIGASYDAQLAARRGLGSRGYTHFHVACLSNPSDVERYHARPCFKVVGTISADGCIPPTILPRANDLAAFNFESYQTGQMPSSFDLDPDHPQIAVVFREPFVFEILGSSFEKPSNCNYWMLRHPRVKKLHRDRTWRDCVSFHELQDMAKQALSAPVDSESQENLRWIDKIERSCRRKLARASNNTTPASKATTSPARPATVSVSPKSVRKPLAAIQSNNSLPTPPTSSAPEAQKRKPDVAVVEPAAKRPCSELYKTRPQTHSKSHSDQLPTTTSKTPLSILGSYISYLQAIQQTAMMSGTQMEIGQQHVAQHIPNWFRVMFDEQITPQVGRCAFLSAATQGSKTVCPLSNSVVFVAPPQRPWDFNGASLCRDTRRIAALHGAHVPDSLSKWAAEREAGEVAEGYDPECLRVFHVASLGKGYRERVVQAAANLVTRELEGKETKLVEFGDVHGFAAVCAWDDDCWKEYPAVEQAEETAEIEWGRRRMGSVRRDPEEGVTNTEVKWVKG